MIKKILSHSFLYAIGPQIPRVISIFILPITTAYLTADDYGISALLMAYTGAIGALKDLGVLVLLINYFFQRKKTWQLLWRRLFGYIILWQPIYAFLQAIIIYIALPQSQLYNYWKITSIYIITSLIFEIPILYGSRYFQLSQKPLPIAIITAITGIFGIFLNLLTIVYFKMGYMGWIISTFVATFISFLFYAYIVFVKLKLFPIFKIQINHFKSLLKVSLPTIPHVYSSYLLNVSDRMILSFYNTPISQIGKYNLAYNFGNYFEVFSTAVGMAVGPIYAKIYSSNIENKHTLSKHFTYLLQYSFLGLGFLIAIWMKEIFDILISNSELKSSYNIAVIIIMVLVSKPFYWSNINLLIFYKQTDKLWRITFTGGLMSVLLNIILVPIVGVFGAVISAYLAIMFINFYGSFIDKTKILGRLNHNEIKWIIFIIILTITAVWIVEINYFYKLVLSALTILIIYKFIKFEYEKINQFNFKF